MVTPISLFEIMDYLFSVISSERDEPAREKVICSPAHRPASVPLPLGAFPLVSGQTV